jgi:hypothetical protein
VFDLMRGAERFCCAKNRKCLQIENNPREIHHHCRVNQWGVLHVLRRVLASKYGECVEFKRKKTICDFLCFLLTKQSDFFTFKQFFLLLFFDDKNKQSKEPKSHVEANIKKETIKDKRSHRKRQIMKFP